MSIISNQYDSSSEVTAYCHKIHKELKDCKVDISRAIDAKNYIESFILPSLNSVYGIIPDGEDEEGQPYSAYYIESMYDSGIPMNNNQIAYLNAYRLSRALNKYINQNTN